MRKKSLMLSVLAFVGVTLCPAQKVFVTEGQYFITDVTNEGVAVVHPDQASPHYLWDAHNGTYRYIGGVSSGNGVGGVARFTPDGKRVFATMQSDNILLNTAWKVSTAQRYTEYDVIDIDRSLSGSRMTTCALLVRKDGSGIMFMESSNDGTTWLDSFGSITEVSLVPNQMSVRGFRQFIACKGETEGRLLECKGNSNWYIRDPRPEGCTTAVKSFTAVANTEYINGVAPLAVGYEAEDGSYGVWYSDNYGVMDGMLMADPVFGEAEGVAGLPTGIYAIDDIFFMTTANGLIQKSADGGKTWETVYTAGSDLGRMAIGSAENAAIICGMNVLVSTDGCQTWTEKTVIPAGPTPYEASEWTDLYMLDSTIKLVGPAGLYESDDNGETFSKVKVNLSDELLAGGLNAVSYRYDMNYHRGSTLIGSASGNFFRKELDAPVSGYSPAVYDIDGEIWAELPNAGVNSQNVYGSIEGVAGDGEHVVGSVYALDPTTASPACFGAVWNGTDDLTVLPGMFSDKASKATASNFDGSIVGGWQDHHGPWYASLWRRGADGAYTQELMTYGKEFDEIDLDNQDDMNEHLMGPIQYITPDGKWIGGTGKSQVATFDAWIWNEDEGYISMDGGGTVSCISADGQLAAGWGDSGLSGWVWSKDKGRRDINEYVDELGAEMQSPLILISVYAMSPNSRYLCGWGMLGMDKYGWVLDRFEGVGVEGMEAEQIKAAVYPNPVASELHVDVPFDGSEINTVITLSNMQGIVCRTLTDCRQSNVIDVNDLAAGMYIVNVNAKGLTKSFKVIVRH